MIRLANVLIVEESSSRAEALRERLGHGGYHAAWVRTGAEAEHAARTDHPDLVLLGTPEGGDAIGLGRALKTDPATGDIPVLLLAEREDSGLCARALDANLDEVITAACNDVELTVRLRPLVRLSTMHAELRQRARTANGLGVAARARVGEPDGLRPALLLIGGAAGRRQALFEAEAAVATCADLFEAEDLLTRRNFDAALIAFDDEPEGLLGFCLQVRNNPRLFNLPLVLLRDGDKAEAYRKGATRVLSPAIDPAWLRAVTLALVRRQQLRWSIRAALNDTLKGDARDGATGAYSRPFLDAYLADRLAAARARDRHLSVIVFAAPNIDSVRRQFGDDAATHLRQQIGQWITGLLRAEDLTASYNATEFCVVLPDTPLVEAEVVMHRIAGILAYTDFAVREVYQAVKVWVQAGCTDAQSETDVAGLVARARRNLD
jgi:diguanylate cyclase (GGDEF) domain